MAALMTVIGPSAEDAAVAELASASGLLSLRCRDVGEEKESKGEQREMQMLVQRENANDAALKAKGFAQKGGVCVPIQQLLLAVLLG